MKFHCCCCYYRFCFQTIMQCVSSVVCLHNSNNIPQNNSIIIRKRERERGKGPVVVVGIQRIVCSVCSVVCQHNNNNNITKQQHKEEREREGVYTIITTPHNNSTRKKDWE